MCFLCWQWLSKAIKMWTENCDWLFGGLTWSYLCLIFTNHYPIFNNPRYWWIIYWCFRRMVENEPCCSLSSILKWEHIGKSDSYLWLLVLPNCKAVKPLTDLTYLSSQIVKNVLVHFSLIYVSCFLITLCANAMQCYC